jgi:hypothetical protein
VAEIRRRILGNYNLFGPTLRRQFGCDNQIKNNGGD